MSKIEWFGEIPSSWKNARVKDLFYISKELSTKENPTVLSLSRSAVKVRDISVNEGQLAASYNNYNSIKIGDLLLNPMDLYSGANCNVSYIEGVISPAYANLRAKVQLDPRYYDFYFKVQYWTMAMFAHGKGVSFENRWTLNNDELLKYKVPIPSLFEQQKIIKTLEIKISQIDKLIYNQQQQIDKLKEYKQSLISEVVTKGLDSNVEYKDSGIEWIGKIPIRWKVIRVKDLSINTTSRNDDENLQYIALENIISQSFDYIDSDNVYDPKDGIYAAKYSVLFGKLRPYLAKSYYCEKNITCSSEFAVFPFDNEITSKYFLLLTQSYGFIDVINMSTYGTKMPRANINFINNITIPLPSAEVQKNIVEYLMKKIGKINLLIGNKNSKIEKLNDYKKSLIYEYVTGKKEVL